MKIYDVLKQSVPLRISLYLFVTAIIVFAIALPNISKNVSEIQQKRAILFDRQNLQLNIEQMLELYTRRYDTLSTQLQQIRPSNDDVVKILETIESKSRAIGLSLDIQNVPVDNKDNPIPVVRYNVSFGGNKTQLLALIESIKNLPVYIEIQNISVDTLKDFTLSELANYQIIFDIFVR